MNFYKRIDELTHAGLLRKQQSITRLFPDFGKKVKGIGDMGGLRLRQMNADTWNFKVHSGTKAGVWYDSNLRWKDLQKQLVPHVKDARLWTKSGEHVDLRKLSKTLLAKADVQVFCSCPAFKYWGPNYILSLAKYDANAGPGENRPPNVRNPKQYGAVCKHLQNVLNVLPWYLTTMAKWLKDFYSEDIRALEGQLKQQQTGFQKAAGELGKRLEDEPVEEPEDNPNLPTEEKPEVKPSRKSSRDPRGRFARQNKVKKPKEDEE